MQSTGIGIIDIIIIVAYLAFIIWWGLRNGKSGNAGSYFLAGRGTPWFIVGLSLFAASISSTTLIGQTGDAYATGIGDRLEPISLDLVKKYFDLYTVPKKGAAEKKSFLAAAKQEIGLRAFLEDGNFTAFTTTFENLYGLDQLPGLACQRLMEEGYGFGAEGDWKTAAFLRTAKVMAAGLPGGVSFMEDYTYHFEPNRQRVLGAHMLEVCPSIAAGKPSLEVHPLGIGGKADPARLVFTTKPGPAINATVIDLGDHFRLIVNELEIVKPDKKLAKLPVASTVWIPKPNLHEGARRWIEAGGAHHSVNAPSLTTEYMEDFARMAGIEIVVIK